MELNRVEEENTGCKKNLSRTVKIGKSNDCPRWMALVNQVQNNAYANRPTYYSLSVGLPVLVLLKVLSDKMGNSQEGARYQNNYMLSQCNNHETGDDKHGQF